MLTNGAPLALVSKTLRHSQVGITANLYGHLTHEAAHAAADSLGGALDTARTTLLSDRPARCDHIGCLAVTVIRKQATLELFSQVQGLALGGRDRDRTYDRLCVIQSGRVLHIPDDPSGPGRTAFSSTRST